VVIARMQRLLYTWYFVLGFIGFCIEEEEEEEPYLRRLFLSR